MENKRDNRKPEWELTKEFQDQGTGLVVQVRFLGGRGWYSLSVGSTGKTGFQRYINPRVRVNNGAINFAFNGMVLARLLDEATLYVQERLQAEEDQRFERKEAKERKQVSRDLGVNEATKRSGTHAKV